MEQAEGLMARWKRRPWRTAASGFALALTIALSVYLLLAMTRSGSTWFASLWFLALLPAVLSALICYVGDPDRTRSTSFYGLTPVVLCGLVCVASVFFLHEGVICLVMISPIWLARATTRARPATWSYWTPRTPSRTPRPVTSER